MVDIGIYSENKEGTFYVNEECIDCDTCVDLASPHFKLTDNYDHAYVDIQPNTPDQHETCMGALLSCPVDAIGKRDDR